MAEKIEGIELEEKPEHSDENPSNGTEVTDEESDYQPIEFHLISDTDEKEALIRQLEKESLEKEGEEETENETPVVEEAAAEEEEKQEEEQEEEPVENAEDNVVEMEEVLENMTEPAEST